MAGSSVVVTSSDPTRIAPVVTSAREAFAGAESLPIAGGRYGNVPGFDEDPARLQFGGNYERLVDVKTKYDPDDPFGANGSVEPRSDRR